jgi:methionyl-tRNA synthetase
MKKFYITTAIDYPNSDPHMGHAYERITADVFARWHRIKGEDVFFSYGLDEHGQKIEAVAKSKGLTPQKFVDMQAEVFKKFIRVLDISNDAFIRTSSEKHIDFCRKMFQKVFDRGDIYKGEYKGNYCIYEETFYTELQLVNGNCPECGRPTKVVSEEAYFFKMGKYQEKLVRHIEENPSFILPETRRNEILARLAKEKLRDLCVSRSSFSWGIPLPNDEKHVIYVWFDALLNYLSVIDYPSKYWPADVHVIGKDIIWFHSVIWPAMLLSMGVKLPKTVFAHGFINDAKGEAMSKSLGNVVNPVEIVELYGSDALRYYLMRVMPSGEDGNFSEKELVERYNKELGNDLGNLLKRLQVLAVKYFGGKLSCNNFKDEINAKDVFKTADLLMSELQYGRALEFVWGVLKKINAYLNEKEPWKNEGGREKVIYNALENLRIITHFLFPFMPESAGKIAEQLGFKFENSSELVFGAQKYSICEHDVLFPRIELEESPEFPLNLRVARVLSAKRIPDADKLYVGMIDLGVEKRQIVFGLAQHYTEEQMVGKHIILVSNLKKAKIRGFESNGMLLAAGHGGRVVVLEAFKTFPGGEVRVEGYKNNRSEISYDEFSKVALEVKNKRIFYNGKLLKTDKEDLSVDVPDGAQIK